MTSSTPSGAHTAGGEDPPEVTYYLGFDCATKTFAFGIMAIHAARFRLRRAYLRRRLRELRKWAAACPAAERRLLGAAVDELDGETRGYLELLDGETKDLVPGVPDKEIHTVRRVRAVAAYVSTRVAAAIERVVKGPLEVVIEFQEGANARARVIVPVLIAALAKHKVYLVGPTLKNKISVTPEGKYCFFAEKYAKSYDANKAHVKANFAALEALFGTQIPATSPPSLRSHVADALVQILGHLNYGDRVTPEEHF